MSTVSSPFTPVLSSRPRERIGSTSMAGHSHAANVARRKNAVDAKRGKLFSKLARAVTSATSPLASPPAMPARSESCTSAWLILTRNAASDEWRGRRSSRSTANLWNETNLSLYFPVSPYTFCHRGTIAGKSGCERVP